jgi:hypothetical protein
VQRPRPIERHPDNAGLLGQRLEDRLADPPHRVADELDAFGLVEFVSRANQTEVAFVDQIGQGHALVLVLLGDAHDEPQVGSHQLVERLGVAELDPLREIDLVLPGDQRVLTDFP